MKASLVALSIHLISQFLLTVPARSELESVGAEKWIKDLASESFQERENASQELWKLGATAMPALREAVLSTDPEVAMRAKEAIDNVELKITKDTPEKILSLIKTYRKTPPKQKLNILSELKDEKAYFQLLKLYSMESAEVQKDLVAAVQDVALYAAREAIVKNDLALAIELLRMAPSMHGELMALACLYRSSGQLDQQLANLNPPQSVKPEEWKGYLLRAKGDLDGAVAHVAETKQLRMLAGLKVLQGDPVMWLEQNNVPGRNAQRAQEAYIKIAIKRWRGEAVHDSDFEPLQKILKTNNRMQKIQAMSSLASLGEFASVQKIQMKQNPILGFRYYISREEISEALEVLGMDPAKPDYGSWVKAQFDEIKKGDDIDTPVTNLIIVAGFMERRGLDKELDEAYSKHLVDMQNKDPSQFLDLITGFFNGAEGAPLYTLEQVSKWAGEDQDRWGEVFSAALGEEENVTEWLLWIREIDPKLKNREVLEVMLAIFQRSSNPGKLRVSWMNRLWKLVDEEKNKELKMKYVMRIMGLCIMQQDVLNTLKAWDLLDKEERASAKWGSIDVYLSAAGRWKEAAEILANMNQGEIHPSPEIHAQMAATLRRGGMEDQARVHDDLADKLAMGSAPSSMRVGGYYVYGGDFERADMWFRRAAIESDPADGEFLVALIKSAEQNVRSRNWKVAASCHEAIVHIYACQQYGEGSFPELAKARMNADLARAMSILPEKRDEALKILKSIHHDFMPDGVLADDFFPALREAGLKKELETWFSESWNLMDGVIKKFPKSHNSRNTAAWFASRAGMKLAEAEKHLTEAINASPEQAAYLDTMAELKFAQGDRKAALEWSQRSVCFAPFEDMIRFQHERFRTAPFPKN